MLIGATLSEGANIAAHLLESPAWIPEIRKLRDRLQEDTNEIRAISQNKQHKWLASKKGCAFLDQKSGDCRIYNFRPTACRTYFVTSDPGLCSPDKPGAQVLIVNPQQAVTPFIHALLGETASTIPPLTGSLQSMVLAGMELILNSSSKFQKWLQTHPTDDMRVQSPVFKTESQEVP